MKKPSNFLMLILLLSIHSNPIFASETESKILDNPTSIPIEVQALYTRLKEIKQVDKSSLNTLQKTALRKELKTIKKQLRTTHNGLYLSLGAIIIIVLLLILIL